MKVSILGIFCLCLTISSLADSSQITPDEYVFSDLNAKLFYNNTGYKSKDLYEIDTSVYNNQNEELNWLLAKAYVCLGIFFKKQELMENVSKKYFHIALREYLNLKTLPLDLLITTNALASLYDTTDVSKALCDHVIDYNDSSWLDENLKNKYEFSRNGNFIEKKERVDSYSILNNSELGKGDYDMCIGLLNFNVDQRSKAKEYLISSLSKELHDSSFSPIKNLSTKQLGAIQMLNKISNKNNKDADIYTQLEQFYCKQNTEESKLAYIFKKDAIRSNFITDLHFAEENLKTEEDSLLYIEYLGKCLEVESLDITSKGRLKTMLGVIYKNQNKIDLAIKYLQEGYSNFMKSKDEKKLVPEKYFLKNELDYLLNRGTNLQHPFFSVLDTSKFFAGIEISSTSVKLTILEIEPEITTYRYKSVMDSTSPGIGVSKFTSVSNLNTIEYAVSFFKLAGEKYKIPANKIAVVFSSGCNAAATRNLNGGESIQFIKDGIYNQTKKIATILSLADEARYTHLGTVPSNRRFDVTSIDIGGDNTKGGYFSGSESQMHWGAFTFQYATQSLYNAVTDGGKNPVIDLLQYQQELDKFMQLQTSELRKDIDGNMRADNRVLFAGGISWVIARTMRPLKIMQRGFVDNITIDDVRNFKRKIIGVGISGLMEEALRIASNLSEEEKNILKREFENIYRAKFNNETCLSGATIIEALMTELDRGLRVPHVYSFSVNSKVAWIVGKVVSCNEGNCN